MELRRLSLCLAFLLVAYLSHCSDARHSLARRAADDDYDVLADEASDDEAQNDGEGNEDEDAVDTAVILTPSSDYRGELNSDVRLECKVSPSEGVVVQWLRDGVKYFIGTQKMTEQDLSTYAVDPRFTIAENSTDLLIRGVQPSDNGVYVCEILRNNPAMIQHRLTVFEAPKIIQFTATDNGNVVEGGDLVLTCDVTGSPPPKIFWSKDGKNGNVRLYERDGEFYNNSLIIRNVKREHAGKYYCYAFNSIGNNQAEVDVRVKGKPRVHVHRTVVNSAINVEAVLQCAVHDEPDSNIRWYKDGRLIENSGTYNIIRHGQHSNLTVIPTSDEDFGTFTCEAENDFGKHNKSIDLVQSPVVENLDVDGPRLSWTIHSHQPLQQIEIQLRDINGDEWRTVSVPVPDRVNHEYDIVYTLDDQLSGKYEATVKVKNEKSWSTHTDSAVVDIEVQPQLIQHASVYRGAAYSLRPTIFALTTTLIYLLIRM